MLIVDENINRHNLYDVSDKLKNIVHIYYSSMKKISPIKRVVSKKKVTSSSSSSEEEEDIPIKRVVSEKKFTSSEEEDIPIRRVTLAKNIKELLIIIPLFIKDLINNTIIDVIQN